MTEAEEKKAEETEAAEAVETIQIPLWLGIEEKLFELNTGNLAGQEKEDAIQKIAADLDDDGYNVSKKGGNLLKLRWAMDDMLAVGRPMMKDLNESIAAFSLDDVLDPYAAATGLIDSLGQTWDALKKADRRPEIIRIVEDTRLDLLAKKAKEMPENESVRFLIAEAVAEDQIIARLGITQETLEGVKAEIAAEKAERARVAGLLEKVEDKSEEEKIKHLITNEVSDDLIIEMAAVDQAAIDNAKKAMEEELKEQQRLAEEEAAKKAAEAAGPALEDIPADEMIDYIDSIREIMEFSDVEQEIRTMCEQSAIPQALVDIAVSDPDKLDELEKEAEG